MQPFGTILIAADFSENSKEAFRAACSLATGDQTRLLVLHVAHPDFVPEGPFFFGNHAVQVRAAGDRVRHAALRRKLRDAYAPDRPITVEYDSSEGDVAGEIVRIAKVSESDLIAMGTHGRTGLRRLLAGSVALSVLRAAHCPVLALRSGTTAHTAKETPVILHPTDFSKASEAALRVARLLARDRGAKLVILHVEPLETLMDGTRAAVFDMHEFEQALNTMRQKLEGPDLKYPVDTLLRRGLASHETVQAAEELSCDLVVMGTHGRTALGRALMGSTAEYVLSRSDCPVLVVKAFKDDAVAAPDPTAAYEAIAN